MNIISYFMKFCSVGFLGFLADMVVTLTLKNKVKLNKYVANSLGFICGCTLNYILNKIWTFKDDNDEVVNQYIVYFIISMIGLMISNGFIYIVTNRLKIRFVTVKILSVFVVSIWNFIMNYCVTFSNL
jgi:putative flippase GtrA